jgi:hypothetical protein
LSCKNRVGLSEIVKIVKTSMESNIEKRIVGEILNSNKELIFDKIDNLVAKGMGDINE